MTENDHIEQQAGKAVMAIKSGGPVTAIVPRSIEDAFRMADLIVKANMAPRSFNNNPQTVCVAIMHGLEVGLSPMSAVQSIAVINGQPTIYGDGALALVRASGLLKSFKEWEQSDDGVLTAYCRLKRRSEPDVIEQTFSEEDVRNANLTEKDGPHKSYPRRMRQMRARSWALRDGFADILKGLAIAEEVRDYEVIDANAAPSPPAPPEEISSEAIETAEFTEESTSEEITDFTDPDVFLKGLDEDMCCAQDKETLSEIWSDAQEELTGMLPPDRAVAKSLYEKHEKRLS